MYTYTYTYTSCIHIHIHIHIHVHIHTYVCTCVWLCLCVCKCICRTVAVRAQSVFAVKYARLSPPLLRSQVHLVHHVCPQHLTPSFFSLSPPFIGNVTNSCLARRMPRLYHRRLLPPRPPPPSPARSLIKVHPRRALCASDWAEKSSSCTPRLHT